MNLRVLLRPGTLILVSMLMHAQKMPIIFKEQFKVLIW